jgi:hypothetical protein
MMIIISYRFSIAVGERGGHFRLPTSSSNNNNISHTFFLLFIFQWNSFPREFFKRLGREIFHQHSDRGNKLLYDDIICLHDNYTFVLYLVEEEYNTPFVSVCVCVCVCPGGYGVSSIPRWAFLFERWLLPGRILWRGAQYTRKDDRTRDHPRANKNLRSWGWKETKVMVVSLSFLYFIFKNILYKKLLLSPFQLWKEKRK